MPFAAAIKNLFFLLISKHLSEEPSPFKSSVDMPYVCDILISQDRQEKNPFFPVQVNMFTAAAETLGGSDSHVTHMSSATRKAPFSGD